MSMNSVELHAKMKEIARTNTRYNMDYTNAIIDCIMSMYMTKADFYEENAIAVLKHFLDTGALDWTKTGDKKYLHPFFVLHTGYLSVKWKKLQGKMILLCIR